jgi:hypothetical protein
LSQTPFFLTKWILVSPRNMAWLAISCSWVTATPSSWVKMQNSACSSFLRGNPDYILCSTYSVTKKTQPDVCTTISCSHRNQCYIIDSQNYYNAKSKPTETILSTPKEKGSGKPNQLIIAYVNYTKR